MPRDNESRKGKKGPKPIKENGRQLKRKRIELDLSTLKQRVEELDSKTPLKTFAELPLSEPTMNGLTGSHYKSMTDIQAKALPFALKGRDILGAAKTGSGKTLAFLIPVLENLYRAQWTELDGLGALIISPTRELALQIFEVLRKIGRYHTFSAGLVIGGKNLQDERERLGRMNILVCTPGRMLQHMDQTAAFEVDNLQMLVLDEADRIMDMGFQSTVDAIVEHLPKERQTLLFSATQTKKVSDLARLSLKEPEYIAVHEAASSATPTNLQQNYIVTPLPEKLDTLWSFIRSNLKSKTIVFFSSGKQVRFVYEAFRHLRPGVPLLHLHGRQKLGARIDIIKRFASSLRSCLFATDVAARGLDFPAVDWVIQADCPEDVDTYIHRVGRTARYERNGRAVLFLEPSEEPGMVERLKAKKIPIEKVNVKSRKQQSIKLHLQNMCFKDASLKYLGQKAFVSYVKSIHIQKDKEVFKIKELPLEEFASAMGLPGAPRIKFVKGEDTKTLKNRPRGLEKALTSDDDSSDDEKKAKKDEKEVRTKYDRMFERRNQDVLTEHYSKLIVDDDVKPNDADIKADADEDEDFLSVKRTFQAGDEALGAMPSDDESKANKVKAISIPGAPPLLIDSKRRQKLLQSKKKLLKYKNKGSKIVYDDDGNAHEIYELEDEEAFRAKGDPEEQRARFLELEAERQRLADIRDKEIAKQKKRELKEKRKERARAEREAMYAMDEDDEDGGVMLAPPPPGGRFGGYSDEERSAASDQEPDVSEGRQRKKQKKSVDSATNAPKVETVEDLEALASGLLA
ncbi:ATP-dependent RNA helicase DBP4 [Ascosphaera apis ARSEF 7405]|uniref:ATP-dependent RNA helicase n=1 Tax=Ascosphaera apis ARSEF 7405 TaxID=392613 RepID=A0A162I2B5_9EURO|nr:ATP-dependent RNA helicase DBP4 [Ascosphaera apis ARSEF 7405]